MKKVIIVTGASSGIGKSTALQLIKEGHTVYGAARRLNKMQYLTAARGHAVEMDVTNHEQVKSAIQGIIDEQGRIDVLVNNAGYATWGPVEETTYKMARRQFEVNIFGLAEVTKAVLPTMRKQGTGKIINVSSVGGKIYSPLGAWYHATKHALEGWSDCLRLELKEFGIDVVIVEPGAIKTEFVEAMDIPTTGKTSDSPYAKLKKRMELVMEDSQKTGKSSPPVIIAETISKAIKAIKPKTRYAAGKMSSQVLLARKILSDRSFDKMMFRMVDNMASNN